MEYYFVEQGGEEFVGGFAYNKWVHADACKDIPCTHGAVVFIHFWAITARLVCECTAIEWGGVCIVAAVTVCDAFCGKASHDVSRYLWHSQASKEERHMNVRLIALVV